jgi:hypothetical protein
MNHFITFLLGMSIMGAMMAGGIYYTYGPPECKVEVNESHCYESYLFTDGGIVIFQGYDGGHTVMPREKIDMIEVQK